MFKLVNERISWIDVTWPGLDEGGVALENRIEAQVVLLPQDEVQDAINRFTDDDKLAAFKGLVRDWRGIGDEGGASLPMTDDNIAAVMRVPMFLEGLIESYGRAYRGVSDRRSLSAGSPADGPQDEPAARKVAASKSKPAS